MAQQALTLVAAALLAAALGAQPGLRIVVIEGEGAVNIIQQKTAVAPVVEVRDRNNVPVGGVTVTFTIQGAKTAVFAGGSQTMTVTTNAAGRAIAAAVNPLSSGTVQIQAATVFQGQTVAATITQTNVMTAAQTTSASAASAGGGAGGGGGGIGTLGIVGITGAAIAGGAAVALKKMGGEEDGPSADTATLAAAGIYALQTVNGLGVPATTVTSPPATCAVITDNARLTLKVNPQVWEIVETSRTDCRLGTQNLFNGSFGGNWTLSGTAITFNSGGGSSAGNFALDQATLSPDGSTLTATFLPPHADAGVTPARVNSTWRK